jgi:N,N'-diacetyllegionaminate synthase
LRVLVDGVRVVERMHAHPVDKDAAVRDVAPLRDVFTKSLVAKGELAAGTVLTEALVEMKKPGTGIPAKCLSSVVGRRLRRSLAPDEQIRSDDLE